RTSSTTGLHSIGMEGLLFGANGNSWLSCGAREGQRGMVRRWGPSGPAARDRQRGQFLMSGRAHLVGEKGGVACGRSTPIRPAGAGAAGHFRPSCGSPLLTDYPFKVVKIPCYIPHTGPPAGPVVSPRPKPWPAGSRDTAHFSHFSALA